MAARTSGAVPRLRYTASISCFSSAFFWPCPLLASTSAICFSAVAPDSRAQEIFWESVPRCAQSASARTPAAAGEADAPALSSLVAVCAPVHGVSWYVLPQRYNF